VHRGTFQANGGNNLPSQEYSSHAWLTCQDSRGKGRELYSDPHRHLSTISREPEKVTSNIQKTYFVITQRWFLKVSNISANCSIWTSLDMKKIIMSLMGSTTDLSRYSNKMVSYVASIRQNYWSDQRTWRCT
jgi:hypothetical protein